MDAEITFTAHNIRLDDGTQTLPDAVPVDALPSCVTAERTLAAFFPAERTAIRVADLGCLEGGFAVEFARMGFEVVGIEVRDANIAACRYVKDRVDLPNLSFVQDDAWNAPRYGVFDAVYCGGLLYHLDEPKRFLELLATVTSRLLILETHFTRADDGAVEAFALSALTEHESLPGRWYTEPGRDLEQTRASRWASWGNRRSFWIQREYLLQAIRDAGFDAVFEQYDGHGRDLAASMASGYYSSHTRGVFVGVKTGL